VGANSVSPHPTPQGFAPRKPRQDRGFFSRHALVLRGSAWPTSVSRRTDGAGGLFSPGVTCRSMNRLVSSERLSSASNARSSTSPAISSDTSLDQPSAVLKATTRRASLYWPVRKIADDGLAIGLRGVGLVIGDAELAVVVEDQVDGDVAGICRCRARHGTQLTDPNPTPPPLVRSATRR
jgi:hypothetical protein